MIDSPSIDFSFSGLIIYAFLLTLYVTGIFAFVGFVFPTNKLLPQSYYTIKNASLLSMVFKMMGVKYFRNALMFAFWGKKDNRRKYFNGTRTGLKNFIYQTKQSEFGHLGAFVVLTSLAIMFVFLQWFALAITIMIINVIGNLYPIILQRYHRIRIAKLIA